MNSPGGVVVVGNGPVGQTTALLLARWGIPVLLLDARPERDAVGSKAICQQRDVLDIWACVGGEAIAAEGLTWTTARTFHRDAELHAWSFVDNGSSPLPPFVNIGQDRTEEILDELIDRQELIEVRWGYAVTGLRQSDESVTLTCVSEVGRSEIEVDHVVIAAGARATALREALGVRFEGESFDDRFLICDVRADLPGWESERRFWFDPPWNPDRQVLIHPCPGGRFRIDWQVPDDFDLDAELASGGLERRIRQILGETPYELIWTTVYRFHSRLADRMRVGRVLLAGDAAHLVAPFGARGLNSGVADAENAAWKLAAVLHEWAPVELLETYHDERHAAAAENLEITAATMRFLVPSDADGWERRRVLLEAARTDPARRAEIDSGRFAEPYWYVDSPLTTPDPTRPFGGRPAKGHAPLPGPGVLVPDVPVGIPTRPAVTRFRQLVRDGFLILTVDQSLDQQVVSAAVEAPVRVLAATDLTGGDAVLAALGAKPGEAWVIRPDGHVAAVVPAAVDAVTPAVRRALALPESP
ncbi:FAD-dependent monooxygenase [Sporichthya polymorpha]|uniref:FAD-dependent monooxygenase n=1 Tax=Sporichthya polymorpha TaxID=35751 RepID=UPI0012EB6222|nr:FAD-dependent monooxygenase [Sporichthya polymorpha]